MTNLGNEDRLVFMASETSVVVDAVITKGDHL